MPLIVSRFESLLWYRKFFFLFLFFFSFSRFLFFSFSLFLFFCFFVFGFVVTSNINIYYSINIELSKVLNSISFFFFNHFYKKLKNTKTHKKKKSITFSLSLESHQKIVIQRLIKFSTRTRTLSIYLIRFHFSLPEKSRHSSLNSSRKKDRSDEREKKMSWRIWCERRFCIFVFWLVWLTPFSFSDVSFSFSFFFVFFHFLFFLEEKARWGELRWKSDLHSKQRSISPGRREGGDPSHFRAPKTHSPQGSDPPR